MSNPHLACHQLETRLREEVQRLEGTIEDMREDMQDLQYELDNCNTPPPIQEETEAEADYRKAREKLDGEIVAAERGAITAKVFNKTAEHTEEWHTAYLAGLRHAANLLTP